MLRIYGNRPLGGEQWEMPDIYSYACRRLGRTPERCLAVEDSPNGVESAYRAGCPVIMIPDQTPSDQRLRGMLWGEGQTLTDIEQLWCQQSEGL